MCESICVKAKEQAELSCGGKKSQIGLSLQEEEEVPGTFYGNSVFYILIGVWVIQVLCLSKCTLQIYIFHCM